MAGTVRAHFVDDLLARLEGAVSPVWITVAMLTDQPPEPEALCAGFRALFERTPRLNLVWMGRGWARRTWRPEEIEGAVTVHPVERPLDILVSALAAEGARLGERPAMRLDLAPVVVQGRPRWAVVARMHHAMGDARALGRTLRRLWPGVRGREVPRDETPLVLLRDREALAWMARRWRAALGVLEPRRRLLARRGVALRRDGSRVGRPMVHAVVLEGLEGGAGRVGRVFLAGVLATASGMTERRRGALRLRMPVDLGDELGWVAALGNTCMAIPLEFDVEEVRDRVQDGAAMVALVDAELDRALSEGRAVASSLECLLSARLTPTSALRAGAGPGLLAEPRSNTLVTTFIGRLDPDFADAPFPIVGMVSHTSTWGAHAWLLRGRMGIQATGFEGLWKPETLAALGDGVAAWIEGVGLGRRAAPSPLWR